MVRYTNRTNLQRLRICKEHTEVHTVTQQQFFDAVYKRLCFHRFFTHHTVHRVTVKQFMAMLAVARLKQYEPRKAA